MARRHLCTRHTYLSVFFHSSCLSVSPSVVPTLPIIPFSFSVRELSCDVCTNLSRCLFTLPLFRALSPRPLFLSCHLFSFLLFSSCLARFFVCHSREAHLAFIVVPLDRALYPLLLTSRHLFRLVVMVLRCHSATPSFFFSSLSFAPLFHLMPPSMQPRSSTLLKLVFANVISPDPGVFGLAC